MSFSLPGDLSIRRFHKTQVILFDTTELIGVINSISADLRSAYVVKLLREIEYPVCDLPWATAFNLERVTWAPGRRLACESDIVDFFKEFTKLLRSFDYKGEQLIVSPSKGNFVLIHFFKE